jgi:hypothetical protein
MTALLAILWSCFAGAAGMAAPLPQADILPPDGFLQTWKKAAAPRVFTASDLYGYIDGGAEIFLEFGFERLTVQSYTPGFRPGMAKAGADEFKVEIYRMSDPVAAAGMYLMNCGRESPDPSLPVRHTVNQFQLLFKRDRYYGIVNNSEGNETLRPGMLEFARYVIARLPAETPLRLDERLPAKGLNKESIRLIRGPYALQSVFTLGSGDILQLGRKLTAVAGSYQDAGGKYTLVLADYPTEQAAQAAWLNVQNHLDKYLTVHEKGDRRLVFKDFSNEYGVVSFAGTRVTVQVHLARKPPPGR